MSIRNASRKDRRAAAIGWLQSQLRGAAQLEPTTDVFQRATLAHLSALFDRVDPAKFDRAVRLLANARNVIVVGTGDDYACAFYLYDTAVSWFGNWYMLDHLRLNTYRYYSDLNATDVIVTFVIDPFDPQFFQIASHARRVGATVIAISDSSKPHFEAFADEILFVPIADTRDFKSRVSTSALSEMLVILAAAHEGDTSSTESSRAPERGRRSTRSARRRSGAPDIRS